MFKNKGFTLIEILAVVTILGIISVLAFPYVDNLLKKTKENEYNRFLDDIYLATEAFLIDNQEDYTLSGGIEYISVKKLVEKGYLKSTITNPKTNQKIDLNTSVKVTLQEDRSYNYEYMSKNYDTDAYVQDGLILMYDGYKKPVLSDGTLLWKDLSGNNNDAVLTGFDTSNTDYIYDNSIIFEKQELETALNQPISKNSSLTVQMIVKPISLDDQNLLSANTGWGVFRIHTYSGNGEIYVGIGVQSTAFNDLRLIPTEINYLMKVGVLTKLTYVFDTNTRQAELYINDSDGVSKIVSKTLANSDVEEITNFSATNVNGYFNNRNQYQLMVYNRALTEEEINKNYEIDKERFGI